MFRNVLLGLMGLFLTGCASIATKGPHAPSQSWFSSATSLVLGGQKFPNGVNDWACKPEASKPPVVLIHGTFSNSMVSFGALGPLLANNGFCVYSLDYGARKPDDWFKGVDGVDESAEKVAEFVLHVKKVTGAPKVSLIGHSQGGLLGFYYLKMLDGAAHVDQFLALAPSVNGTKIAKTPDRNQVDYCLACADQHPDSKILKRLHKGPVTIPGVRYSVLASKNDTVVVPVSKQFVREPGVTNIMIQDYFPAKRITHSGMLYDPDALSLMLALITQSPLPNAETAQSKGQSQFEIN